MYLFGDPLSRQTFRGSFIVLSWNHDAVRTSREESILDPAKDSQTQEQKLRQSLTALYRSSELRSCFVSADILALDR